uniref:Uncharacterized protein n=1 Tax=Eptatretus burgeri TaxID=7764 RepID=A0A8C4RBB1_EPTBU
MVKYVNTQVFVWESGGKPVDCAQSNYSSFSLQSTWRSHRKPQQPLKSVFYRPLNVRVALIGVEVWSNGDLIQRDYSSSVTMKRFLKWRRTDLLHRVAHDNAQLVGVFAVASTIAHEIGHNLGMNHDMPKRSCICPIDDSKGGCIMQKASGFIPGQMFSSCSRDDLEISLRRGGGMCLFNVPSPSSLYGGARCGNLYVEEGEECDCGLPLECDDPCCNATVCKLMEGAQCAKGRCCKDCKVWPEQQGIVCREVMDECDLPEMCDGKSGNCPGNVYIKDGTACQEGEAYCYNGFCLTLEEQCLRLWGEGATPASEMCYKTVNTQGTSYGNCGEDISGQYVTCSLSNVMCGKLQCKGGKGKPQLATDVSVVETKFTYMGTKYVCRGISYNLGDDVSDPGIVNTGTKCGSNKVTVGSGLNQKCVQWKKLHHDVCNSNENCHCDVGWAPPTCSVPGNGGSIDSGPYPGPITTSSKYKTGFLRTFSSKTFRLLWLALDDFAGFDSLFSSMTGAFSIKKIKNLNTCLLIGKLLFDLYHLPAYGRTPYSLMHHSACEALIRPVCNRIVTQTRSRQLKGKYDTSAPSCQTTYW